eukprot:gene17537-26985_t
MGGLSMGPSSVPDGSAAVPGRGLGPRLDGSMQVPSTSGRHVHDGVVRDQTTGQASAHDSMSARHPTASIRQPSVHDGFPQDSRQASVHGSIVYDGESVRQYGRYPGGMVGQSQSQAEGDRGGGGRGDDDEVEVIVASPTHPSPEARRRLTPVQAPPSFPASSAAAGERNAPGTWAEKTQSAPPRTTPFVTSPRSSGAVLGAAVPRSPKGSGHLPLSPRASVVHPAPTSLSTLGSPHAVGYAAKGVGGIVPAKTYAHPPPQHDVKSFPSDHGRPRSGPPSPRPPAKTPLEKPFEKPSSEKFSDAARETSPPEKPGEKSADFFPEKKKVRGFPAESSAGFPDFFFPVRALGPPFAAALDEWLAALRDPGFPAEFRARMPAFFDEILPEQQRAAALWRAGVSDLVSDQRFRSEHLAEGDFFFGPEIAAKVSPDWPGADPPFLLRAALTGPKDSGKSTVLHVFANDVLVHALCPPEASDRSSPSFAPKISYKAYKSGTHSSPKRAPPPARALTTLVIPLNLSRLLNTESRNDVGAVACLLVQHFVEAMTCQRPHLARWKGQVASYWKKCVVNGRPGTLPEGFCTAACNASLAADWAVRAKEVQVSFGSRDFPRLLESVAGLPMLFAATLGFSDGVFWLVDGLDTAHASAFATDGSGAVLDGPPLSLVPAITAALSHPCCHYLAVASDDFAAPQPDLLPKNVRTFISTRDFVSPRVVAREYPALPSVLRFAGRDYPLSVFNGCPGYLAPFIKLFQVTAAAASPGGSQADQRSVEFYGAAVENLLQ